MAHADYDCCAVCDRKLAYNSPGAETKAEICPECEKALALVSLVFDSVDALIQWIKDTDKQAVWLALYAIGFRRCHYPNEVDNAVAEKGITHFVEGEWYQRRYLNFPEVTP